MAIEDDPDVLLELMELAVTWPELEYSEMPIIPPDRWMIFVESHPWADPDRVERIFGVATDIVMAATRASKQRLAVSDCQVRPDDRAAPAAISDNLAAEPRQADVERVATVLAGEAIRGPVI